MTPHIVLHRANSHQLFEKALQYQVAWVEFDVRRTREKELVLFHDPQVGGEKTENLTRKEMEELAGFSIPSLEEILSKWGGQFCMDIELKEEGYEKEVMDLALSYLSSESMVATSFQMSTVEKIKRLHPQVRTGLLVARNWPDKSFSRWIPTFFPLKKAKKTGADFLAPHYFFLSMGILRRARALSLPLWFWTVNKDRILAKTLQSHGVEGVITDDLEKAEKWKIGKKHEKGSSSR